jgi:hypothetical protein
MTLFFDVKGRQSVNKLLTFTTYKRVKISAKGPGFVDRKWPNPMPSSC